MDPITILILIFLLFPLLRRIFEGLKGGAGQPEKPGPAEDPWSQPERQARRPSPTADERRDRKREERGEQSWEDFFEGLEKVLSGDEPDRPRRSEPERPTQTASPPPDTIAGQRATRSIERTRKESSYRHPSHGPVHGGQETSADSYHLQDHQGADIGAQADRINRELTEGDNPIYQDIDDALEVAVAVPRGKMYVKSVLMNPEKLRDGILIKEILDPPKARRKHHPGF